MEEASKRIVPWISVEEWTRVYQQVYSDSLDEKREGLNQMTLWKSRVAKLSLGVECSLYLLQAILRDEEYKLDPNNALSESDVVLMYSTAIIRFINLISHLGQVDLRHQPISAIAEMAGIPDWLVSIRHEATHAKMPSLEILRPGAQMAMEWLKENYWRTEEEDSFDLYWPESRKATSRMLRATNRMVYEGKRKGSAPSKYEVIPEELQLAMSMLVTLLKEMSSKHSLNEIQSRDLHQYAYEIWQQSKPVPTPLNHKEIANLDIPLKKIRSILFAEIERILSEWVAIDGGDKGESSKVNLDPIKGKCYISALCQCPNLLKDSAKGTLFTTMLSVWKQIQSWKMIPELMYQLTTLEVENEKEHGVLLGLISDITEGILEARSKRKTPNLLFKYDKEMRSTDWHRIVLSILQKEPHPETWNAVSKLFQLYNEPVDEEKREKVAKLLRLYLGNDSAEQPKRVGFGPSAIHSKIYTVEMLNPPNQNHQANAKSNGKQPVGGGLITDPTPMIDEWTLCPEFDWSRIPLGSTPGVKKTSEPILKNVEWKLIEAESNNKDAERLVNGAKRTGERFDWNSLMRKRRRRGGHTKEAGMVGQQQQQTMTAK